MKKIHLTLLAVCYTLYYLVLDVIIYLAINFLIEFPHLQYLILILFSSQIAVRLSILATNHEYDQRTDSQIHDIIDELVEQGLLKKIEHQEDFEFDEE